MEIVENISILKITHSRLDEVDFSNLEFGKYISDHMLVCDYVHGVWLAPQILPFANLSISPSALALHYGQTVFEGMKAFRTENGTINIFRIEKHYERFVRSLERMCMAIVPKDIFMEGVLQLVKTDNAWVPAAAGSALYIRPFVFASEARMGVKVADEYRFIIFTGPVPSLYAHPIKVKVETHYTRAAKGGTGSAKCGGNYGAAFLPTKIAKSEGYDQVLWTDGKDNKYIEESGMMNVMFVINGVLVTPPISDSILDGVTRDSLLTIANDLGYKTEERPVSIDELQYAFKNGTITEAFGAGTAAVVAPISLICINGVDYPLPFYNSKNIMFQVKKKLDDTRFGIEEDIYNWNYPVDTGK
ncbi:MAG: branched-chain amino acid aminotransferase [Ginsengibacter sp.]